MRKVFIVTLLLLNVALVFGLASMGVFVLKGGDSPYGFMFLSGAGVVVLNMFFLLKWLQLNPTSKIGELKQEKKVLIQQLAIKELKDKMGEG